MKIAKHVLFPEGPDDIVAYRHAGSVSWAGLSVAEKASLEARRERA